MESLKAEDLWGSVFSTTTLIEKIVNKKEQSDKQLTANVDIVLSISSSMNENVFSFIEVIHNESLRNMTRDMIEDMYTYSFDDSSSVTGETHLYDSTSDYDKLKSITLMQHTFGVVNQMHELIGQKYGLYSDLFLLLALLHDFGKSSALKRDFAIDQSLPHHEASSEYLRHKIHSCKNITPYYRDLLNKICVVMEAHHSRDKQSEFYPVKSVGDDSGKELEILFLEKLKEADSSQRLVELDLLTGGATNDL